MGVQPSMAEILLFTWWNSTRWIWAVHSTQPQSNRPSKVSQQWQSTLVVKSSGKKKVGNEVNSQPLLLSYFLWSQCFTDIVSCSSHFGEYPVQIKKITRGISSKQEMGAAFIVRLHCRNNRASRKFKSPTSVRVWILICCEFERLQVMVELKKYRGGGAEVVWFWYITGWIVNLQGWFCDDEFELRWCCELVRADVEVVMVVKCRCGCRK